LVYKEIIFGLTGKKGQCQPRHKEDVIWRKKRSMYTLLRKMKISSAIVETVQSFLKKLKVELSYDVPKGNEGSIQK
jgi:hypothetical protein